MDDSVLECLAEEGTFVGATTAVVPGALAPPQVLRSLEQLGRYLGTPAAVRNS